MKSKPNILLIFTDMQRSDTIAALGNNVIKTPNLDRLVREGTAFTSCYSPSPVCVPARCCMHYGIYPQKTGLFKNGIMMDDNGKSMASMLEAAGYKTHAVGKRHFTPERNALRGFGSIESQEECTSNPETDDYCKWLKENGYDYYEANGARGEMYYVPQVSALPEKAHPSQWVGNRSVDFIKESSKEQKPWMLFSSFIHPHPPFAPPKPWHKLYRSPMMPPPDVPQDSESLHTWINLRQNRYKYRDQGIDHNLMRVIKAYYYAAISFVDFQIGKMIKALEETGELDNTLIVFASDHGEYLGDYNCFGKRSMHDASSKVPLIARYPERFKPDVVCENTVSLIDILPTFASVSGADISRSDYDGEVLSEIADGSVEREFVFSQFGKNEEGIYMIANKEWKYFYSAADDMEFLFNRKTDLRETRNLAGNIFSKDARDRMKKNLLQFLKDNSMDGAYEESGEGLEWKKYPLMDNREYRNPDFGLMSQDYPAYEFELEGYTD
jgi:arylsulfatase A-like enzyme